MPVSEAVPAERAAERSAAISPLEEAELDVIRIEPPHGMPRLGLVDLWRYRQLVRLFARQQLQLRYRQTLAGVAWVAIQPLLSALVFTLFFGHWLKVSSSGIPYVLFVFCGIAPWTYFVHVLLVSTSSVVTQRVLVTKVWFPRITLPFAPAVAALVDLAIAFAFLGGLLVYYGVPPHLAMFAVPGFVLMLVVTVVAVGLWLAALDVWYRDVAQALPFFTQLWFFATPVAYSRDVVPPAWRWIYDLNPMVGVIEGLRWSILGTGSLDTTALACSCAALVVLFFGGLYFYQAREGEFADVV